MIGNGGKRLNATVAERPVREKVAWYAAVSAIAGPGGNQGAVRTRQEQHSCGHLDPGRTRQALEDGSYAAAGPEVSLATEPPRTGPSGEPLVMVCYLMVH
jgi:hypothetical protein